MAKKIQTQSQFVNKWVEWEDTFSSRKLLEAQGIKDVDIFLREFFGISKRIDFDIRGQQIEVDEANDLEQLLLKVESYEKYKKSLDRFGVTIEDFHATFPLLKQYESIRSQSNDKSPSNTGVANPQTGDAGWTEQPPENPPVG